MSFQLTVGPRPPLAAFFWNRTHLYLVTPLYGRGTLLQNISCLGIEEDLAKLWFQQILLGIGHIHGKV